MEEKMYGENYIPVRGLGKGYQGGVRPSFGSIPNIYGYILSIEHICPRTGKSEAGILPVIEADELENKLWQFGCTVCDTHYSVRATVAASLSFIAVPLVLNGPKAFHEDDPGY